MAAMPNALTRYRIMAYVTGVGLVLLVCVAMPLKYFADSPGMVHVIGMLHGYLYILYIIATFDLGSRRRWPLLKMLLVMLSGTIPFAVFFVEHRIVKEELARTASAGGTASDAV